MTEQLRTEASRANALVWLKFELAGKAALKLKVSLSLLGFEGRRVSPLQSSSDIAVGRPREQERKRSMTKRERQRLRRAACSSGLKMTIVSSRWRPRA